MLERFDIAPSDLTPELTESVDGSESLHLRGQLHGLHALLLLLKQATFPVSSDIDALDRPSSRRPS